MMDPATTILAVLLAIPTLNLFVELPRPFSALSLRNQPDRLFGIQLLCVLVWQLLHIRNEEYNVDESTWIANALAVLNDENFVSALLTHTTARPVTVLPLLLLNVLQLPITFFSVKVVSVVFILLTLTLTYLSLRNLTNARLANLFLFPLTIFYLSVRFYDFLAYNSELVCNVLVVSGLWLYSRLIQQRDRPWQTFFVALLIGLIPFAKFQAIPGALIVVAFCLYQWVRQRRFGRALLFVLAGLLPTLAAVIYCQLTDQLTVLIRNYFLYYFHYSYQYSAKPISERFWPGLIFWYYTKQYTFAAYWFGLVLLMGVGAWQLDKSRVRPSATLLMAVLLWLVSIYETIQAGTSYEHYLILTLVPHTLLAAVLLYPILSKAPNAPKPVSLLYGFPAVALCIALFGEAQSVQRSRDTRVPIYDDEVVKLIRNECSPGDGITIWGWADRYYVLSGVAPATRYANSVFQMKDNAQQTYYLDQYVQDLRRNKPILFVDAVAQDQFTYDNQRVYGHERFPTINQIVTDDYQLIYEHDGLRAYRLKDGPSQGAPRLTHR